MLAPSPPRVARPLMLHRWTTMTFLHWAYPRDVVQPLLPAGLEIQTFGGRAWVGLLPFLMQGVRAPGVPPLPWLSAFPETNLRTYVRGPDGQAAIWFFSLEAARLPAVLAARATYWLPYFWADMAVERDGRCVMYRSRRRWPGPRRARCEATIQIGEDLVPDELTELDHFLTARYVLYTVIGGRLASARAEHPPWPLARATIVDLQEDLVAAAGLPAPLGEPLVHHSPGVPVRIGPWKRVPAARN